MSFAYVTDAGTARPFGQFKRNVVPLIVLGVIASLKVAETAEFTATFFAKALGTVDTTVGAMSLAAVVNVQIFAETIEVPATS